MIWFLLGIWIGGAVGFMASAILTVGKQSDVDCERIELIVREGRTDAKR